MNHADVVVVGLGAMGSATTYQLTKRGVKVIGIDRFSPPHHFGSTHGDSRITRRAVYEHESLAATAARSYELWREIEDRTDADILTECGGIRMMAKSSRVGKIAADNSYDRTVAAAVKHGIEHEILNTDELHSRFPQFHLTEDHDIYYEPGAGFLRPENAVGAQLQLAERLGADLRRNERVQEIHATNNGVSITTDKETYAAGHVILSAGPWISKLAGTSKLADVTQVSRQLLHWFDLAEPVANVKAGNMPVYVWRWGAGDDDFFYGFPAIDGQAGGLKVATEQYDTTTDADDLNRDVQPEESAQMYATHIKNRLPVTSNMIKAVRCLYTVTPDSQFIIDTHPNHENVLLASPCSGHGFKHSAAIGESLAQLAIDGRSDIDLTPFALSRFNV